MSVTDEAVASAGNDPRVSVYRVIDATELAYLRMHRSYGSNPNGSGKYFALTLAGARAFAVAPMNAGSTITETTLPRSIIVQGFTMIDPGPYGAGPSVHFAEAQLPLWYTVL